MTQTSAETHTLRLKHVVAARRDRVFRAFTDPDELAKWWAPEGFTEPSGEIDLRVGGTYRWSMLAPDGESYVATGTFTEIEAPEKLVQTWQWEGDDPVTKLTLLFHDRGEGPCRSIIERIRGGELTVTEIASPFPISMPAISRHLRVLQRAGRLLPGDLGRAR